MTPPHTHPVILVFIFKKIQKTHRKVGGKLRIWTCSESKKIKFYIQDIRFEKIWAYILSETS